VHPQSVTHGFVIFTDGSVKSQLAAPDMRIPIGFALSYPRRLPSFEQGGPAFSNDEIFRLLGAKNGDATLRYEFEAPDPDRFPCVRLAYEALSEGGTQPTVLSAANEVAVAAFVEGRIPFGRIADVIEGAMNRVRPEEPTLQGVRRADGEARTAAGEIVAAIERPTV
jgi:1-deoxy-D-xylulose-5-phosphate reductoisomerase